ncbi:hypothetical protein AV530_015138 [Patagioenas fasciata monilis]|uniref:Uncharacterized protein n=1 Tax=Patagioenas fasciata monilis TaxID=372326 RepID=A0A1V4K1B6_PATFA|nr:hypothetical protein AV530_015138 [Patagioenas fasciata monilis]
MGLYPPRTGRKWRVLSRLSGKVWRKDPMYTYIFRKTHLPTSLRRYPTPYQRNWLHNPHHEKSSRRSVQEHGAKRKELF